MEITGLGNALCLLDSDCIRLVQGQAMIMATVTSGISPLVQVSNWFGSSALSD